MAKLVFDKKRHESRNIQIKCATTHRIDVTGDQLEFLPSPVDGSIRFHILVDRLFQSDHRFTYLAERIGALGVSLR